MEAIEKKEVELIKTESQRFLEKAENFQIVSAEDQIKVSGILKSAKESIKVIKAKFKDSITSAKNTLDEIKAIQSELLTPYEKTDYIIREKNNQYLKEQYQIAEQKRKEEEKKRMEAEQREKDRLAKLAEKQMENEKFEKAEDTIERIEEVFITPVIIPEPERQIKNESGGVDMTARKDIKIDIVNVRQFLQAALDGKMPIKAINILNGKVKTYIKDNDILKKDAFSCGVLVEDSFSTIVR